MLVSESEHENPSFLITPTLTRHRPPSLPLQTMVRTRKLELLGLIHTHTLAVLTFTHTIITPNHGKLRDTLNNLVLKVHSETIANAARRS